MNRNFLYLRDFFRQTIFFIFFLIFPYSFTFSADYKYKWIGFDHNGDFTINVLVGKAGKCPKLEIEGKERDFAREENFYITDISKCFLSFSRDVKNISVGGQPLGPLPSKIRRIGLIGDTGCSVFFDYNKKCIKKRDKVWPFASVANALAKQDIDLIVHLGDLIYIKQNISQYGFNKIGDWKQWDFEFFSPAQKLLEKAPIIMVRGNHESAKKKNCYGMNFFFYYNEKNNNNCHSIEDIQKIVFDNVVFFNMDSSIASDFSFNEYFIAQYREQLQKQIMIKDRFNFLLSHRPFWSINNIFGIIGINSNKILRDAIADLDLPIDMIISGHLHLFQFTSFSDNIMPQLISGNGGAKLHHSNFKIGNSFNKRDVDFVKTISNFGFVVVDLEENFIKLNVHDFLGNKLFECAEFMKNKWGCKKK